MKVSKFTLSFVVLFVLLVGSFAHVAQKYYPFLFGSLVYHCEHLICSTVVRFSTDIGTLTLKLVMLTVALTLIKLAVNYVKIFSLRQRLFKRVVRGTKYQALFRKMNLGKKVLVVADRRPFAFCLGFLRPKIVISTTLLRLTNPQEMTAILHHEQYHLDHKDALVMLLAKVIQSLFPFFPTMADQIRLYAVSREVKADRQAVERMGDKSPLISALKKLFKYDLVPAYSTIPAFGNYDHLEIRVRSLLHGDYRYHYFSRLKLLVSALSLLVLLGLTFAPLHTSAMVNQGKEEVVACINTDECLNTCQPPSGSANTISSLSPEVISTSLPLCR